MPVSQAEPPCVRIGCIANLDCITNLDIKTLIRLIRLSLVLLLVLYEVYVINPFSLPLILSASKPLMITYIYPIFPKTSE